MKKLLQRLVDEKRKMISKIWRRILMRIRHLLPVVQKLLALLV
jgi:hypothetical protein